MNSYKTILDNIPDYQRFLSLDELNNQTVSLANKYPDIVELLTLGYSRQNKPIYCLKIGTGSKNALLYGSPHPNEPVGCMMLTYLTEALVSNKDFLDSLDFTWYIVKCCDPDGLILNEGWLNGPFDLYTYARNYFRPIQTQQVDWTFPINYKKWDYNQPMPESTALMKLVEDIKPDFIYSLHNFDFGGVFWFLSEPVEDIYKGIIDTAVKQNIPLHQGEIAELECFKPLHSKIFHLIPSKEIYDFFESLNVDPLMYMRAGGNCSDYCKTFCKPLTLVTEVPYFYDSSSFDHTMNTMSLRDGLLHNHHMLERCKLIIKNDENILNAYVSDSNPFMQSLKMYMNLNIFTPAQIDSIEFDDKYSRLLDNAEVFHYHVSSCFAYLLSLGTLARTYEYELKNNTKLSQDALDTLTRAMESSEKMLKLLIGNIEEKSDYTIIPIKKLIAIQLESGLLAMDYLNNQKP